MQTSRNPNAPGPKPGGKAPPGHRIQPEFGNRLNTPRNCSQGQSGCNYLVHFESTRRLTALPVGLIWPAAEIAVAPQGLLFHRMDAAVSPPEDGLCSRGMAAAMYGASAVSVKPGAGALVADQMTVRFDGLTAVDGVDFVLGRENILGLIGPNGAGKTTVINVLTGFQRPSSGRVLLDTEDVTGEPPHRLRRRGIARTFQSGRLFREMPILENVEVPGVSMGLSRRQARAHALELLGWLGIAGKAHLPAAVLPYTDERRVGIARALAMRPAYVLLDEPAAGMSDLECDDLMRTIAAIPGQFGCGVLLIEHNMRVIMGVCERVQVLAFGRTIAAGTPAEVQANAEVIEAYLGEAE